jgi:hypothetical protein
MQQQGEAGRGLPIFLPSVGRRFREWKTPVAKLEGKSLSKDFERHNIEQDSDCNNIVAAAPELRRRMLPRAVDVRLKFFIESCGKVRGVVGVLCFAAAQGGTVGECLFLDLANLANHCKCRVSVNVNVPPLHRRLIRKTTYTVLQSMTIPPLPWPTTDTSYLT